MSAPEVEGGAGEAAVSRRSERDGGKEKDVHLPQASVDRIVKAALPDNVQVGRDARVAFCKAASVFILYLTATANEFCRKKKRATITAPDIIAAAEEIEFAEFVGPLRAFLEEYREKSKKEGDGDEEEATPAKKAPKKRKVADPAPAPADAAPK